jgi:Chitinase
MKTRNIFEKGLATLLCTAVFAGFAACSTDPVEREGGKLPDKEPLENTYVLVRSQYSPVERAVVYLMVGTGTTSDPMYCRLNRPAEKNLTIRTAPDESQVEIYNTSYGTDFLTMPAENIQIAGNGQITIAAGERISEKVQVTFKADGLEAGEYLAPIVVSSDDVALSDDGGILYYVVKVRKPEVGDYELDPVNTTVFYVNTSEYSPLLADVWVVAKEDLMNYGAPNVWERTYGNIVNLRVVQIGYDEAAGRAKLVLNSDIRYVLEHADLHIRPLQDKGRKVCLSIEGSNCGLGFCNLSDAQIADFVAQVKACLETYDLDGVNLFDRNAGYGDVEGMPAMNTTSYPKLIKALREAMPDKLLTLSDYEEPTEYFWDTEATGGIEVGKYLDYAWSGYMSEDEDVQILDPWGRIDQSEGEMNGMMFPVNNHLRKPIAGLEQSQYGAFAVPFYSATSSFNLNMIGLMNLWVWRMLGWSSNNILMFGDLITNIQGEYEGQWNNIISTTLMVYEPDGMDGMYGYGVYISHNPNGNVFDLNSTTLYYGDYAKDW